MYKRILIVVIAILIICLQKHVIVATPQLHVVGNHLEDITGHHVILRGLASMGMGMIYGDKANPGTYVPFTPAQYIDKVIGIDTNGNHWYSTAIRLNFERFPSSNPARLYTDENTPYAMPDTISFSPWQSSHAYTEGAIVTDNGNRYRGVRRSWRADKGQDWNPGGYIVGDVVVSLSEPTRVYTCTAANTSSGVPEGNWENGPNGTTTWHEDEGPWSYDWSYIGVYGTSGTTAPHLITPISEFGCTGCRIDNLMMWVYMSVDYDPTTMEANFADWKSHVMDPVVDRAKADGLYVIICEFDFGPAHFPLREARMLDFWPRMANAYKNDPQILFELWNESETLGTFEGGPGSWSTQKPVVESVISAIRATGANNIILVPPPFYSAWVGEATSNPVAQSGYGIAYTWHQYREQWEAFTSNRDEFNTAMASGQAVIVTEWGDGTNIDNASGFCDSGTITDPDLVWPLSSIVSPPLKGMFEPSNGASPGVAGWFAWAHTLTWCPATWANSAFTLPSTFGESARRWLEDKRFDSQASANSATMKRLRFHR